MIDYEISISSGHLNVKKEKSQRISGKNKFVKKY